MKQLTAAYVNLEPYSDTVDSSGHTFLMHTEQRTKTVIIVGTEKPRAGIDKEMEAHGITVHWAATIKAAGVLLQTVRDRTVVITELALRDGNWRDAFETVRLVDASIPVLIVSSISTAELWWDALECGIADILAAPLSASRLREYLEERSSRPKDKIHPLAARPS